MLYISLIRSVTGADKKAGDRLSPLRCQMLVNNQNYIVKIKFHSRDETHLPSVIGKGCIGISPHPPLRGTLSGLGEGYRVRLIN